MPVTNENLGLAEPSTVTAVVATVLITRGSTDEHQEILTLGDPMTSNALARVTDAAPDSTMFAAVVRQVGYVAPSTTVSIAAVAVPIIVRSTADTLLATVTPNAGSTWAVRPVQSSQADLRVTAYQSTQSELRATIYQSTAGDLNVTVAAPVIVRSSAADFGATVTPAAGSTWSVRPLQSSAADLQVTATPAAGSTWAVRPLQSSAADLQATVTPAAGSTWAVRPVQSSQGDLRVTTYQSTASENKATVYQSTAADLRMVPMEGWDSTYAAGSKATSGATTIISSGGSTRIAIYAYTFSYASTTPTTVRLISSGASTVEMWRATFQAPSSASIGANMAVGMPAYLFRTAASAAVVLDTDSTVTLHYAVSAYRTS